MQAPASRLATLIEGLVRALRTAAPPPRALPYLGLEHASGTGFHLLDALAARGIFRKYEIVLDLGAGLGGTSRWLASRLGCEVVGVTADVAEAAAGTELSQRAGLAGQVRLVAAAADALPFSPARFTHVWAIETLARRRDSARVLSEAWRAVRRGGTLALQELVVTEAPPPAIAGLWPARVEERVAALHDAGFVDVEVRDRTDEAAERSARVLAARARLLARLRAEPALAPVAAERDALALALAAGSLRVVQLLARRP